MKRRPKRARPLWGAPKRRQATDFRSCYSMNRHEPVTIAVSFAGSSGPASPGEVEAIAFEGGTVLVSGNTYTFPRGPGPRGALTFTTDGTTPNEGP